MTEFLCTSCIVFAFRLDGGCLAALPFERILPRPDQPHWRAIAGADAAVICMTANSPPEPPRGRSFSSSDSLGFKGLSGQWIVPSIVWVEQASHRQQHPSRPHPRVLSQWRLLETRGDRAHQQWG